MSEKYNGFKADGQYYPMLCNQLGYIEQLKILFDEIKDTAKRNKTTIK